MNFPNNTFSLNATHSSILGDYEFYFSDEFHLEEIPDIADDKTLGSHVLNQAKSGEKPIIENESESRMYFPETCETFPFELFEGGFVVEPASEKTSTEATFRPVAHQEIFSVAKTSRSAKPLKKKRSFQPIKTLDPKVNAQKRARKLSEIHLKDIIDIAQIELNRADSQKRDAISKDTIRSYYLEQTMKKISQACVPRPGKSQGKEIKRLYIRMINALYQDKTGEVFKGKSEYKKINNLFASRKRRMAEKQKQIKLKERLIELENKNILLIEENERLKLKIQELSKRVSTKYRM